MKIQCPKCQVKITVKPQAYGKLIKCPKCSAKLKIPNAAPSAPTAASAPAHTAPTAPTAADDPFGLPPLPDDIDPLGTPTNAPLATSTVHRSTAKKPGRRGATRKKGKSNSKLWIWLSIGAVVSVVGVGAIVVAAVFISGFTSALKGLQYDFEGEKKNNYTMTLSIPTQQLKWSADVEHVINAGKVSYTTKMSFPDERFGGFSQNTTEPESGSFDLPRKGFGGYLELPSSHLFPFFMGNAATAPIIPLSAGKEWNYNQKLALKMDEPVFGLQPGETLNAMWESNYNIKFQQRNQTVIVETRTVTQTDKSGAVLLSMVGEHTFDDRTGILDSKLKGTYNEVGGRGNIPLEYELRINR